MPWTRLLSCCRPRSASLYLIKQVRDESTDLQSRSTARLRGKAMTVSLVLDDVPGVGPAETCPYAPFWLDEAFACGKRAGDCEKFKAFRPMSPKRSTRHLLNGMPSAPRHRPTVPKTKCASKQLIYMIGRFSIIFSRRLPADFWFLLTLKRLTSHGEQPCYPAG